MPWRDIAEEPRRPLSVMPGDRAQGQDRAQRSFAADIISHASSAAGRHNIAHAGILGAADGLDDRARHDDAEVCASAKCEKLCRKNAAIQRCQAGDGEYFIYFILHHDNAASNTVDGRPLYDEPSRRRRPRLENLRDAIEGSAMRLGYQ